MAGVAFVMVHVSLSTTFTCKPIIKYSFSTSANLIGPSITFYKVEYIVSNVNNPEFSSLKAFSDLLTLTRL